MAYLEFFCLWFLYFFLNFTLFTVRPHLHLDHRDFGQCLFTWVSRLLDWVNFLPQRGQWYGLSPVCTRSCLFRAPEWLKLLPQCEHLYGFSPVWTRWCIFKALAVMKALPHSEHTWSLTPVCIFSWSLKVQRREKLLPQIEHKKGFSFEWIDRCVFKCDAKINFLPHWSHVNGLSPEWYRRWPLTSVARLKVFPHWRHVNGLASVLLVLSLSMFCDELNDFSPAVKCWDFWYWWSDSRLHATSFSSWLCSVSSAKMNKLYCQNAIRSTRLW